MTRRIEDLTDESNNGRKSNMEDHEDNEDDDKSERATLDADSHTYNLAKLLSSSNCLDSRESSLNLSNLNLGKFILKRK